MSQMIRKSGNAPVGFWSDWDPFRAVTDLMGWEPWSVFRGKRHHRPDLFLPRFDVKEVKDGYVFQADVPGVKENDLDMSITGHRLTISGKREAQEQHEGENHFVMERTYGSFSRTFTLPEEADTDRIKAEMKDGVLHVMIPKKTEAQSKKVQIGIGSSNQNKNNASSK